MAISRETIEQKNIWYTLLRPYVNFVTKTYFRTTVHNFDNIPEGDIIIYAPNHQNALMDALAILATVKTEPVFLARADIFKKKTIAKILTFLKILPIYRIRDGKENLKNNDAIFQKTIDVLKNKNGLVILPEGNHAGVRKLRTLKKGISRIVFEAEEANDFKLNIKIVPVGLDWTHYSNFRSRLFINFGKPIPVSDYYGEYKKNPPRGLNLLRERIAEELKKYMIHIDHDEYYEMYNILRYLYLPQMIQKMGFKHSKQPNNFYGQKKIIRALDQFTKENPEEANSLKKLTHRYAVLLKKLNFRHWVFQTKKFSTLRLLGELMVAIFLFPVYLYGGILNYLPYKIPVWATKKIKDPQFVSSFRNVVALLLFPTYYIILAIPGTQIFNPSWITLVFILTLPFTGLFAFHYFIEIKKLYAKIRYKFMQWFKNRELREIKQSYDQIINRMDRITERDNY
ncbi:MAG: 1-acyl-sn-glycerol-3-phosphate acyltransferase [Bacteroidales bacterium]|jgi:1-acyl-sn-glycerol-3-phosphate acyltransferase|nr:1-acyl-sn-glycerol-3-phosphate acyltransferase [Bacteroidales bacterium]